MNHDLPSLKREDELSFSTSQSLVSPHDLSYRCTNKWVRSRAESAKTSMRISHVEGFNAFRVNQVEKEV